MQSAPIIIPVPFSSLSHLVATASRFCGRESSELRVHAARRKLGAGDVVRLALLAPELRFPIDVNAQVVARTYRPEKMKVRYTLADLSQMECALGQLYRSSGPRLPVALDVATDHNRACRLCELAGDSATFEVEGQLTPHECAPDSQAWLQLPYAGGRLNLPGRVSWVTPRLDRSRLRVGFDTVTAAAQRSLEDIVCRFRLGAAPWTPRLVAAGL